MHTHTQQQNKYNRIYISIKMHFYASVVWLYFSFESTERACVCSSNKSFRLRWATEMQYLYCDGRIVIIQTLW